MFYIVISDAFRAYHLGSSNTLHCFSVVNVVGSQLARLTNCGVYLNAGREVAVASTKAFTSQVVVLSLIAAWFAQHRVSLKAHKQVTFYAYDKTFFKRLLAPKCRGNKPTFFFGFLQDCTPDRSQELMASRTFFIIFTQHNKTQTYQPYACCMSKRCVAFCLSSEPSSATYNEGS